MQSLTTQEFPLICFPYQLYITDANSVDVISFSTDVRTAGMVDTNATRTLSQPSTYDNEKNYAYSIMKMPPKYIYVYTV